MTRRERLAAWLCCAAIAGLLQIHQAHAQQVNLTFVGDVMLDDGPGRVVRSGRDPLANVAQTLSRADIAIGNLECALATSGDAIAGKPYTFRAHPRVLRVLKGRFDALALSNNHSGDYGPQALLETMQRLEHGGIRHFGAGRNLAEAHAPLWFERRGLRIALLGYDEFLPRAFEAGADRPGVAWSEDDHVVGDIRAARAAGADLVIPFMHWGWEGEPQPGERQRELARRMIDAGADVVVGGHPHVTQGAEYYRGKLIVYSLGNFVFDGFDSARTRTGWMLGLTMDRHGLVAWQTRAVFLDAEGTPHPVPGAVTPCGRAGDTIVGECENR
jgi:poly-gamma-glutamate capsule biosynthesis protein CapA/YwtB (metallophosphatase superfamily)